MKSVIGGKSLLRRMLEKRVAILAEGKGVSLANDER